MPQIARGVVLVLCWASVAVGAQSNFRGRSLEEALRLLQQAGLQIVFSSEVVQPTMRVLVEPRSANPRQQLDELLAAHGLKAEKGPGRLIVIVRDPTAAARRPVRSAKTLTKPAKPESHSPAAASDYSDTITVLGLDHRRPAPGVSGTTFDTSDVQAASSLLAADGLEAVRSMPRVSPGDDLRSEVSVRGSPYRQVGLVIDGVATPWLQHMIYGRSDAGSLSMFGADAVDRMTLDAGAYARRYEDILGAQLEVSLKEGSREATRFSARAGGTSAAVSGEGPIGSDHRGSWTAGVRNSFRSWPPMPRSQDDVGFAFGDVHAKLVYDISAVHQISVMALGGRSALDAVDEPLLGPLSYGSNRAALISVALRSTLGSRTVVRQRLSLTGQDLVTTLTDGQLAGRSRNRALGYRGEVLRSVAGGILEAGGEVSRMSGAYDGWIGRAAARRDAFGASWTTSAAYVNFGRTIIRRLSFEGGARVSDSTLVRQRVMVPWINGTWRFGPAWSVNASAGASAQFPEADAVLGIAGSRDLVPEHATHLDIGIAHRLRHVLLQATYFDRVENEVLRGPDLQPKLLDGVDDAPGPARYRNALSGTSRGMEVILTSAATTPLSGSVSYAYATAGQTDVGTRETFWSDFDRRHVLTAASLLQLGSRASIGAALRAASGAPIPGYFEVHDAMLFAAGEHRNAVRVRPYVRVDARARKTLFSSGHTVTLFGEVLNALNRPNEGVTNGVVLPGTGQAVGFLRPLLPRTLSIGIEVNVRR